MISRVHIFYIVLILAMGLSAPAPAADWPMYAHDIHRSNVTEESLAFPLKAAWTYLPAQAPCPAWADTVKMLNRSDFDYSPQPVAAGGMVCIGSSADDTVRALDAKTGALRWQFTAGGPVRFAPHLTGGKVYFAADDGYVYCLDAATGTPAWTFRAAPDDDMFVGNSRMISRWPIRTGVLVDNGVVYCVAGMWPSEGIYVYALAADTGKVLWCNDTSGFSHYGFQDSPTGNHQGEFIASGVTPQGTLLANDNVLLVPQGLANPTRFDRKTGRLGPVGASPDDEKPEDTKPAAVKRVGTGYPGSGGNWVTIDGDDYYVLAMHRNRAIYLNAFSVDTGIGGGIRYSERNIVQLSCSTDGKTLPFRTLMPGQVSVIVHDGKVISRNAYRMVLAGDTLLLGEDGYVAAVEQATNKELWRAPVHGKVYGIAVADGRLIATTNTGEVTCFVPAGQAPGVAAVIRDPQAPVDPIVPNASETALLSRLADAGMDRGYALVLGDPEGRMSRLLAARTALHIVNALADPAAVARLRERLPAAGALYGTRIHVQPVGRLDRLPFAQYFANAVIVAGPAPGLPGKELYRVLRPCGGMLLAPGLDAATAKALLDNAGALDGEAQVGDGTPAIVRGRLPGANDWNTGAQPDQRVKWPLRPLWFGGPKPVELADYRDGELFAVSPTAANGRYFVQSENSLSAVDAYNGTVLWTRPMPGFWANLDMFDGLVYNTVNAGPPFFTTDKHWRQVYVRSLGTDTDHVYLTLGEGYFRGKGAGWIQLDARTGAQQKISLPYLVPDVVSLDKPQSWPLNIDDKHSGTVLLQKDTDGLSLTLTTTDPDVSSVDSWDLFFDFRPRDQRYGLYERGTFHLHITPALDAQTPAAWAPGTGVDVPAPLVEGTRTPTGTTTTVRLPWKALAPLAGNQPSSFGFAALLNSSDGKVESPVKQCYLFCDHTASGLNNGWANVYLAGAPAAEEKDPALILAPIFVKDTASWSPRSAAVGKGIVDDVRLAPRLHPLTGEPEPRFYRSGTWACGGPSYSATSLFRRPSKPAIGIYDFADDSGLRFFGGVAAPCGSSMISALGLFIFSESRFRCDCNPPIRTSLALAPAEKRLNEDWALYFDLDVDTQVRQANLNFGAFGDRRDETGALWLAFPRITGKGLGYPLAPGTQSAAATPGVWMRHMSASIGIPMTIETYEGGKAYRENADRIPIKGTDRPWLYASGFSGLKKAVMTVNFLTPLASLPAAGTITVDGKPDEKDWTGDPTSTLPHTGVKVFIRHDAECLYILARRPAVADRLGKTSPWTKKTVGEDALVWNDDSFEVFLGSAGKVLHLGVSASSARYDALAAGQPEDVKWSGLWKSAVAADDQGLVIEMAVPWTTLTENGFGRGGLGINVQMNQKDISSEANKYLGGEGRNWNVTTTSGEALIPLGMQGRAYCTCFVPLGIGTAAAIPTREFTVRLHFAELDEVKPGQRIFDIKLQGQTVLKGLDIAKEAGARTALVKEFPHIKAGDMLALELVPAPGTLPPTLCAFELRDETFQPALVNEVKP